MNIYDAKKFHFNQCDEFQIVSIDCASLPENDIGVSEEVILCETKIFFSKAVEGVLV